MLSRACSTKGIERVGLIKYIEDMVVLFQDHFIHHRGCMTKIKVLPYYKKMQYLICPLIIFRFYQCYLQVHLRIRHHQ